MKNQNNTRNIVGLRVKQARKMSNPPITQLDLLARLQVLGMKIEQPAISKIESGIRPLNVSVKWLLGEKE